MGTTPTADVAGRMPAEATGAKRSGRLFIVDPAAAGAAT
jgi:hypothetical protein